MVDFLGFQHYSLADFWFGFGVSIFVLYIVICWIFFSFQFCSMVDFFVFEYCPKTPMLDFKFSMLSLGGFFFISYCHICWILVSNIVPRGIFWFSNNALW